jgi:hypothetical protein
MQVVGEIFNALPEDGYSRKYLLELILSTRHRSHKSAEERRMSAVARVQR